MPGASPCRALLFSAKNRAEQASAAVTSGPQRQAACRDCAQMTSSIALHRHLRRQGPQHSRLRACRACVRACVLAQKKRRLFGVKYLVQAKYEGRSCDDDNRRDWRALITKNRIEPWSNYLVRENVHTSSFTQCAPRPPAASHKSPAPPLFQLNPALPLATTVVAPLLFIRF